jgi:hypothetical protein
MGIPEPPVRTTVVSTTTLSRVSHEVRIVAKIATGLGRAKSPCTGYAGIDRRADLLGLRREAGEDRPWG